MVTLVFLLLAAQQEIAHRTYDVNGNAVAGARTTVSGSGSATTVRNANGREVPVETVEERVLGDGIIERTVRRFDPNGRPGPVERLLIETQKAPDGTVEVRTTVHRGDINGNLSPVQRSTAVTRGSETVETIERPGVSGRFDLAERRETTRRSSGETTVVQQTDVNGRLYESARTTVERSGATENRAEYEATNGQMQFVRQTVTRTDGDRVQVDIYTPGLQGQPRLSRQQIIEKIRTADGVSSVTSVRLVDGSGRLSAPRVVQETRCAGQCDSPASVTVAPK